MYCVFVSLTCSCSKPKIAFSSNSAFLRYITPTSEEFSRLGLKKTPTTPLKSGKIAQGCPRYDTKQSDIEVPIILELWGMQSTPSLPSLPGPLW